MAWTKEQAKALELTEKNRLLSAAAGSGKTAVLTERILRMVSDPDSRVDVTDLLVLTFTRAAAAEMQNRIAAKLTKALEEEMGKPAPDRKRAAHLSRQATLLPTADITTLDAFFQRLIREYGYHTALPPDIRLVADENETSLLAARTLDELMERKYAAGDADFLKLTSAFERKYRDQPLRDMVLALYTFSQSSPFPEEWLESLPGKCAIPQTAQTLDDIPWAGDLLRSCSDGIRTAMDKLDTIRAILAGHPAARALYESRIEDDYAGLRKLAACHTWQDMARSLATWEWKRMPGTNKKFKNAHPELSDTDLASIPTKEISKLRKAARAKLEAIQTPLFTVPAAQWIQEARSIQSMTATLSRLTRDFTRDFKTAKKEAGIMDFNDAAHYVLDILLDRGNPAFSVDHAEDFPSAAALALRSRYKEILIDEYQDTNDTQDLICALLARRQNRFMVGDIRQSIYRFRQADPSIFLEKYNKYVPASSQDERITLNTNFRSDPVILSAINYLFRRLTSGDTLEFSYGDGEAMHAGRTLPPAPENYAGRYAASNAGPAESAGEKEPSVSVELILDQKEEAETDEQEEGTGAGRVMDAEARMQLEGELAARQIRDLIDGTWQVSTEENHYRDIRYSDIAILIRSPQRGFDKAALLADILEEHHIPARSAAVGELFLQTTEVEVLLALLKVLDNPMDELSLTAVLRSIFVGLSEEDIAALHAAKRGPLWSFLTRGLPGSSLLSADKETRVMDFLTLCRGWFLYTKGDVSTLLEQILRDTDYLSYVSGLPRGGERRQHVRELCEAARQAASRPGGSLYDFLAFLYGLSEEQLLLISEAAAPAPGDAVTITSIHKSKGLEYPVVFVMDLSTGFYNRGNSDFLCHRQMGLGLPYYDENLNATWTSLYYKAVEKRLDREQLAEEARVLYVAMSRARDKLFLIGSLSEKKWKEGLARWTAPNLSLAGTTAADSPLPPSRVLGSGSFLDWIMTGLLPHPTMAAAWAYAEGRQQVPVADAPGDQSVFDFALIPAAALDTAAPAATPAAAPPDPWQAARGWLEAAPSPAAPSPAGELTWTYPHSEAVVLPAKLTATGALDLLRTQGLLPAPEEKEAKGAFFSRVNRKPAFLTDQPFAAGNVYGTLMHKAMEQIDFTTLPTAGDDAIREALTKAIRLLEGSGFTGEEADFLLTGEKTRHPLDQLLAFAKGPLAARMRQARRIHKEMPFTILLPLSRFSAGPATDDRILLHGVMDCLLEMEDGLTIIDYKTDRFSSEETFREHYSEQLLIYKEAAEKLLGSPVTGLSLWSFEMGKEIRIPG